LIFGSLRDSDNGHCFQTTAWETIDMVESKNFRQYDKNRILADLIRILSEMMSEWEMEAEEPINSETLLGADLGFKSLDFVRFISIIQGLNGHKILPFQDLLIYNNEMVNDIAVSSLVDFLHNHLSD
jgi:hypothetical protein